MEALVAYYRKFESAPPDFRAVVKLGAEDFAREEFKGRSTTSRTKELPMAKVLAQAPGGASKPLTFAREGTGTLFYTARLRYASDEIFQEGLDNGIRIARSYAPYVETGTRPAATSYKAGDLVRVTLVVQADQRAPLSRGYRPAAGRLRGRRIVVCHDCRVARARAGRSEAAAATTGSRGGSVAASITSSASTTASSSLPRASAKAGTSSPTSSAPRPPARSARRRRGRKRCIRRKCLEGHRQP